MPVIPSIILSASILCGTQTPYAVLNKIDCVKYENVSVESLKDILKDLGIAFDGGTCEPTAAPDSSPSAEPTAVPTEEPETEPTAEPTEKPTAVPAEKPTAEPTEKPTAVPTAKPTAEPTAVPTAKPTAAPTAEPTAKPTAAPVQTPSTASEFASEVVRLVNEERAKAGLSALTTDATLTAAANKRAVETADVFSHTRPNGESCFTVLSEYGIKYKTAGENIAYGQKTPEAVVNAWMNSAGHRKNILSSSFTKIGVGIYKSGNTYYWTQMFIG